MRLKIDSEIINRIQENKGDKMTVKEYSVKVGKTGLWSIGGVKIEVAIKDVRQVFGRVDFLISPKSGHGEVWVSESGVQIQK